MSNSGLKIASSRGAKRNFNITKLHKERLSLIWIFGGYCDHKTVSNFCLKGDESCEGHALLSVKSLLVQICVVLK